MTYTLDTIITCPWFTDRINENGSPEHFKEWWKTTIYSRIASFTFEKSERIITRYERVASRNAAFNKLMTLCADIEFPEIYNPETKDLYVFSLDARQEKEFRLSRFSENGGIISHEAFDSKEDALIYAANHGCTELRVGEMDKRAELIGFHRSLVFYAAQQANKTLDEYLLTTSNEEHMAIFSERIQALKKWEAEKA